MQDFFGFILPEIWGHTKFGEKFVLKHEDEFLLLVSKVIPKYVETFGNSPNLETKLSAKGLNMSLKLLEYLGMNSSPNLGIHQTW